MSDLPPENPDSTALARTPSTALARHLPGIVAPGAEHHNTLKLRTPSWIEIELLGEDDSPIPNEKYRILLPDGAIREGVLDENGLAQVEKTVSGTCKVSFPDLDKDAWEEITA